MQNNYKNAAQAIKQKAEERIEMGDENTTSLTQFGFILMSYLQLLIASMDSHPILQNLQKIELGKLVFPVATTTAVGLLFSPAHYFLVPAFMVACALLWNGMLFGTIYPRLGSILQILATTLILCLLCVLMASFLPVAYSWLSATLFLLPLLYIIFKPKAETQSQTMVDA